MPSKLSPSAPLSFLEGRSSVQRFLYAPLMFLFIASLMGLFLRYQLVAPFRGIVYANWLHGHSHVMFLGWVFNALLVAFTVEFVRVRGFTMLFGFLQVCVAGMLVAFPLQGYGLFSIAFSTLHTLGSFVFVVLFFRASKEVRGIAVKLARVSLLFFVLASIAPFFLGYLKASGQHHSPVYRLCIYFYLHFEYNGCFFFGVLSLFMRLVDQRLLPDQWRRVKMAFTLLIVSCFPAYFLSALWANPGVVFNVLGWAAAAAQLVALYMLSTSLWKLALPLAVNRDQRMLFGVSYASLLLKMLLQLISAHPAAAGFADEYRAVVIAYLHVVMVGFVSLFLIAWLIRHLAVRGAGVGIGITLLLCGFVVSELLMAISPWDDVFFRIPFQVSTMAILICSVFMVLGLGILIRRIMLQIARS